MQFFCSRPLFIAWFLSGICDEKCCMCEWDHWNNIGANPAQYRSKFAMSKLQRIHIMCVKALTLIKTHNSDKIWNKRCYKNIVYCSLFLLTILSIEVWSFEGGDILRPVAWEEHRWFINFPPFLGGACPHSWLSILVSLLFSSSSFLMEGMKQPLYRQQGSLFQWVGAFHIREVHRCCPSSWHRGYLPFHSPLFMFGLVYCDQVPWVVTFIVGFTICQHQWALTSFPPP